MRKILHFLATDGAFLYEEHHCYIVGSEYIATFGGTGSVTLRNDVIELKFWLERDRLFVDVHAVGRKSSQSWYSIDILSQLITGQVSDKAELDHENLTFLKTHFSELQDRFNSANLSATENECKKLEKQRSKRVFG